MKIFSNISNISCTQNNGNKKKNHTGILIPAVGAFTAEMATPLLYGNGFKEYKNRNKFKLAACAIGLGAISALAKYGIDKISDEKRKKFLNTALGISIIPLCLIGDYHSALTKKILKEKNQKFCKSVVDSIKKFFDTL